MAVIPLAPPADIFEPKKTLPTTEGFDAVQRLFGEVGEQAARLNAQQTQADKLIGSNQIQSTIRGLQTEATSKFPGNFSKQQDFVNQSSKAFLQQFIPGSLPANRGYFGAVSKNLLTEANFTYTKNITAQNLKNQKQVFDSTFNETLINNVEAIRNNNKPLAEDNIGHMMISLNNAEQGGIISPQEKQLYQQKMLMSTQLAGAKTQIDAALAQGGTESANAKLREIISDPNNDLLADPRTSVAFTSQLRSYKNAITSGLKASASANKDKVKDILNNTRLTGNFNPQDVAQFDIEDKNAEAVATHATSWDIFTSDPLQRQNILKSLDLAEPSQVAVKKTVGEFEAQYKKDPMGFIFGQIARSQHGTTLANATPEQLLQMRTAGVEIQEQRGDLQIKPATSAEMIPIINAARSGNVAEFNTAYEGFVDKMGKLSAPALVQLGQRLTKAGINGSITDISGLDDPKGKEANQILAASVANMSNSKLAAEQRLGITPQKLTEDVNSVSQNVITHTGFFTTGISEKFVSSIKNMAGTRQGEILGVMQKGLIRYMINTVSNGTNATFEAAAQEYINGFASSNHYMKTTNSNYISIPMNFRDRPLDQNKVIKSLKTFQSKVTLNKVDVSEVPTSPLLSRVLTQERWWNSIGSYTFWKNSGTGESYVLYGGDGLPLKWKDTKEPIILNLNTITKSES